MRAKNLRELIPRANSKFFFDTNIWLYLYFPQFSQIPQPIIARYSNFYSAVRSIGSLIVTDMIQMSELINLVLHLEYRVFLKSNNYISFKEFWAKPEYKNALQNAKIISESIMKATTFRGGIFSNEDLKRIVSKCDLADFNDIYFSEFCAKENAVLITHDFDFNALETGVELFTYNNRYLN
jgi:hypothetical protein